MNGYICFYNGKRTEIHAEDSYSAELKAIDFFKPLKSKKHMISVVLAEVNNESVVKTADF